MSINLSLPKAVELTPRIVVIGVGGAGGNAVNNMIASGLDGVEFVVANTDAQALAMSKAERRVQMGAAITQGLGAGMRPEVGEESAENSIAEIMEHLDGAHMLFVAAGMGGGTGTGAAPIVAQAARERGILTVGIVTKPFQFEGSKRMRLAEAGIEKLYACVDTLLIIPNQNLFRVATENTTMTDAFAMADEVLNSGVRSITDLMVIPGEINLDFSDVKTVMEQMGKAMMGTGEATGERRAVEAAESAISNPLLDDVSLAGAKRVLVNITGGEDLTLFEVDEAANLIKSQVDPDADIIVGTACDSDLEGIIRISVVATGVEGSGGAAIKPQAVAEIPKPIATRWQAEADVEVLDQVIADESREDEAVSEMLAKEDDIVEKPAEYGYRQPNIQTPVDYEKKVKLAPDAPVRVSPPENQTVVKRPFGFFGRKKSVPIVSEAETPQASGEHVGDLFGADTEDNLEIPSFMRRDSH